MDFVKVERLCAVALAALAAGGCSVRREVPASARPSDQEIAAQIQRDIDRTGEGTAYVLENLEINPSGVIACAVIRTPGEAPLVVRSMDMDFSDDRRVTSYGVVGTPSDFSSEPNQRIRREYLRACHGNGLLLGVQE
jgi:hypothetical protein